MLLRSKPVLQWVHDRYAVPYHDLRFDGPDAHTIDDDFDGGIPFASCLHHLELLPTFGQERRICYGRPLRIVAWSPALQAAWSTCSSSCMQSQ